MSVQFKISDFDADRFDTVAEGYKKAVENGDAKAQDVYLLVLKNWDLELAKEGEP